MSATCLPKWATIFIPLCALSVSTAEQIEIKTEKITLSYDNRMHCRIDWSGSGDPSILESNGTAQMGIKVENQLVTDFELLPASCFWERSAHEEFGPVISGFVSGIYESRSSIIERQTRFLLPINYPDVVLFRTLYRNASESPIHIEKVFSQRLLLNRRLAEAGEKSYDFASFQGGVYVWGSDYSLIWLTPGFYRRNFMGIHDVDNGRYRAGGGLPLIDVWGKTMGVAIAHLEKKPAWVSLPVQVREDGLVEMAITEEPSAELGQTEWLNPGEDYETVWTAVIFHKLDYHDPLRIYGNLLRCRGIAIKRTSSPASYEPYWMSWGFKRDFTVEKILNVLPSLGSIGIRRANLDAGWFEYAGDWNVDRSPGKFPNGDTDIEEFVVRVKESGFRTALWWHPFAVSPESDLARERPDLLVQAKDGSFPREEMGCFQLCPAYEPALKHLETLMERFLVQWGFDGFYVDKIGLSAVPPCYNKAHNHKSPLDSFEAVPEVFKIIERTCLKYVDDPFIDVCICATPHSPYNMPYYPIASASDPVNPQQMRRRVKAEKAIHGPSFAVGDSYQLPADEWGGCGVQESFESSIGTGAKMTAQYADLDSAELKIWRYWFHKYIELELSSGEYLNLYDIAFDDPEIHVVRKGEDLYFGIYADYWPRSKEIELRGLKKNTPYTITDYGKERELGTVNGSNPFLNIGIKEALLIRAHPSR